MKKLLLLVLLAGGCYTYDLGPSDGTNIDRCMRKCAGRRASTCDLHGGRYCTCH